MIHRPTFAEQSAAVAFKMFFAFIKASLVALVLVVAVLVAGQSKVAPVSARLLTTLAMEGAITLFKPYRSYFPQPYLIDLHQK